MVVPCIVKIWSYCVGESTVLFGTASWARMSMANATAIRKNTNDVADVHEADALVVCSRDPRPHALASGPGALELGDDGAHDAPSLCGVHERDTEGLPLT